MEFKAFKKLKLDKSRLHELGVFAEEGIARGEAIMALGGKITNRRTRYSLQVDENGHLANKLDIDDRLNHSCDPNCYVDFELLQLKALKDLKEGEELTYNYCTAEDSMLHPFQCICGAKNCFGVVKGFDHLTPEQKLEVFPFASPYLKRKYLKETRGAQA